MANCNPYQSLMNLKPFDSLSVLSNLQRRSRIKLFRVACFAALAFLSTSREAVAESDKRLNIVFIMADDLGYGELGCFGQKIIRTPHVDRLAADGMKLTRHYAGNPVCATSRCVLMTGQHPGHATIRTNRAWKPEGQWPIHDDDVTFAEVLQDAGYVTGGFGKWGLGGPDTVGRPLNQGFDHFFGYNCQAVAHNFYPTFLRDDGEKFPLNNVPFSAHQKLLKDADPNDPASYERFQGTDYSADIIAERARSFVRENSERPFFLYYPTTVPHLAIQVPDDSLDEYTEVIKDDPPYPGGHGYLPHFRPRAGYAAMVTRMDRDLGLLFDLLDELDLSDNTLVVFTSDNGPTYDRLGGSDSDFFASAAGMKGLKGSMYDGGVRVPTIVRWPGKVAAGTKSDVLSGFEDWFPTLTRAVGVEAKNVKLDGIDLTPALTQQHPVERNFLYREFPSYGGQQAVWSGNWKAIRQNLAKKSILKDGIRTELYDLKNDFGESTDVAAEHPEIVAKLEAIMEREHVPSELFPILALDGAKTK